MANTIRTQWKPVMLLVLGLAAWTMFAAPALAVESSSPKKHLLLDSRLIEKTEGVELRVGKVKKHPACPLFSEELPWEHEMGHMYPNVVFDEEDQLYKIWYYTRITSRTGVPDWVQYITPGPGAPSSSTGGNCATLYAYSQDGISWTKPGLDVYHYKGKPTSIVVWGEHGTGVFRDPHAADPQRRFKIISGAWPTKKVAVGFSPDGIHWSDRFFVANARADTHNNALWAPTLNKYVAFTREYPDPGIRTVLRMESDDYVSWTAPVEVLRGPAEAQTYSMPVFRYADIYLGLPAIYHLVGEEDPLWRRVDTEVAWSPDTVNWNRIDEGNPILPLSDQYGDPDWGLVYAAAVPVVLDDEIRIYYSAQHERHSSGPGGPPASLFMATLRPDGWAGYETTTPNQTGTILTTPVLLHCPTLRISADVAKGGSIRVAIVDDQSRTIDACKPITKDVTDGQVRTHPKTT